MPRRASAVTLPSAAVLLPLAAVLLLSAAAGAAAQAQAQAGRAKHLARPAQVTVRNSTFCSEQVAGCSVCVLERPAVAPGAKFPGGKAPAPADLEPIVRCTRCRGPSYYYNNITESCDCALGSGTAWPNGMLIAVDVFEPPSWPTDSSDAVVFPPDSSTRGTGGSRGSRSSGSKGGSAAADAPPSPAATGAATSAAAAAGAQLDGAEADASTTTATFSDTASSTSSRRAANKSRRRRFEQYLVAEGFTVRRNRRGTLISRRAARLASFASTDASRDPAGEEATPEQPLMCVSCKGNMVSGGGMIGGSFCMPCGAGTKPDAGHAKCVSTA